jgi:hypothetical protein
MRFVMIFMALFVALTFSGVSELSSGILDDESSYTSLQDDNDSGEKEDSKENEEKDEKEDVKESLLPEDVFFAGLHYGPSLEIRNGILLDSGYYPEDHSPPPERA